MGNYLPEVLETVRDVANVDTGNVFSRRFLFPKASEKRIDAQKEVLKYVAECNKEITLAKLEAEKEVRLAELHLSYELQKLKYETLCQLSDFSNPDSLSVIGDVISNL